MRRIALTQGYETMIDDSDFDVLSASKWYALIHKNSRTVYAARSSRGGTVRMHCEIMGNKGIDHRDGDGLNNQRSNLRVATMSQNIANAKKRKCHFGMPTTSRYKGVCWYKRDEKWQAYINRDGKRRHIGYFSDECDAALAYNLVAFEIFGEFARFNLAQV